MCVASTICFVYVASSLCFLVCMASFVFDYRVRGVKCVVLMCIASGLFVALMCAWRLFCSLSDGSNFSSIREWIANRPEEAALVRRAANGVDGWLCKRFSSCSKNWPWHVASIADRRLEMSQGLHVATLLTEGCDFYAPNLFSLVGSARR